MNNNDLREKLIIPAVVGALYAALTMLLAPISYGNLQFRISEALCVLPVFFRIRPSACFSAARWRT